MIVRNGRVTPVPCMCRIAFAQNEGCQYRVAAVKFWFIHSSGSSFIDVCLNAWEDYCCRNDGRTS